MGAGLFGKKAPIEDLETRKLTLQVFSNQMAMIYFYSLLNHHYQRVGSECQTLFEISRLCQAPWITARCWRSHIVQIQGI